MTYLLKHRPSEQVFRRAMKAVEGRMNARPLTFIPMEPDDLEPLTPNHFLLGYANNVGSPFTTNASDEYSKHGHRRVQYLQQQMWKRWLKEYLPVLTRRTKWYKEEPDLAVGDKVLVIDGNQDWDNFKKAVVEETIPGKDKRVRVVRVKMENGTVRTVSVANIARLKLASSPGVTGVEDVDAEQQ